MKKYLLLLLISTSFSYGQTTLANKLRITGNTTDNIATKVNVQATDGTVNTISKVDLQDAFYFASASNFPVTGITDKLYIARDNNILYRFNGTIYVPLSADVSGKEDIANKSSSFTASSTVTYANTKALVDGLATKQNTLTNPITGLGTTFTFPIFSTSSTLENSMLSQSSNNLFVNGELTAKRFYIDEPLGGLFVLRANGVDDWVLGQNSGPNGDRNFSFFNFNTASTNFQIKRSTGNVLINTTTDNTIDKLQINGTVSASPATLANQVVVKSQLDLKANIASPALTGTPTAPTPTEGSAGTQIANKDYVLANGSANAVLLTGDQSFTGVKTFTNPSGGGTRIVGVNNDPSINGLIELTTNANGSRALNINHNGNGIGIRIEATSSSNNQAILVNTPTNGVSSPFTATKNGGVVFQVNNLGGTTAASFIATAGTVRLKGFTVATLPAGVIGDTAYVTDALAPSYMVAVMGGGAVVTVVFFNGTNWVSH